ncbi:uncharacterized protein LOC111339669 isoform X3 [Stylophora pistillata]|uniref:uncharacterized protein LOC111339669 isoform X3 n=1 Tax=Stylophora pistillata TaxID=50429 RepID=UPI000C048F55|nr:uncharacterized protein LOC111339669 isoform X3 [Stylophora pistillata]
MLYVARISNEENSSVLVLFIWSNVAFKFVQCRSTPGTYFTDETRLAGQMEPCLNKCGNRFQTNDAEISSEELSSHQMCYDKCLLERGKLNSVVDNQDVSISEELTSSFKRIKREILGSEKNDSDACLMNSSGTFMHPDTKVTFQEPKDNGSFMANVTWEPLLSDAFNWTGYRFIYAVGMVSEAIVKCVDLYKNETSYLISSGLPNDSRLRLSVVSIPFSFSHDNFTLSIDCHIPCNEKPTISGTSTLNTSIVVSPTKESSRLNVVLASTLLTIFMCVVAALLIFFYCHRLQKKAFLRHTGSFADIQFEYDAFVIYSSQDSEWVVKTLIPTLEEKHGLKCCVHYRDFPLGVPFRQNMVDSVYKCKKTVAVVSTHFFNSNYCGSELDYALHRLMEKKDDSLVVVKLDEVDRKKLPRELQKRSYIDYTKSTDKETWERKLVKCLKSAHSRPE